MSNLERIVDHGVKRGLFENAMAVVNARESIETIYRTVNNLSDQVEALKTPTKTDNP